MHRVQSSATHWLCYRSGLDGIARAVAKLAADGARLLKEQRIAPGSAVARQQIGAAPSLGDCVSGLQALRYKWLNYCCAP